jgi:hypothetical protein
MKDHASVLVALAFLVSCGGATAQQHGNFFDHGSGYRPPDLQSWGFELTPDPLDQARNRARGAEAELPPDLRDVTLDASSNHGLGLSSSSEFKELTPDAKVAYAQSAMKAFRAYMALEQSEPDLPAKEAAAAKAASAYLAALTATRGCTPMAFCGFHYSFPGSPQDELEFLAADLFVRLGMKTFARGVASTTVPQGSQYAAALDVIRGDTTCDRLGSKEPDDRGSLADSANRAYRSAVDAGGTVGAIAARRTVCNGKPGQLIGSGPTSSGSRSALYLPPNYERWGLIPPTMTEADAQRLVDALRLTVPQGPDPFKVKYDHGTVELLLQLGRAYLNLEVATPDVARKYETARKALEVFRRTYPARAQLHPWEQTETLFLAADLAWRLNELNDVSHLAPVGLEKADQYNALALILSGDALCEQGGEDSVTEANSRYYTATRIGGAASEIAAQRNVCGNPTMRVAEFVRQIQAGTMSLDGPPQVQVGAVLAANANGSWPSLTTIDRGKAKNELDAALVVGVERYMAVPGVAGASKNATDWYMHFTNRMGLAPERVALLRDEQATLEKIETYAKQAAAAVKPGGTLWFVFIGHGAPAKDGKDGVLVGADAQQDADSLYARSIAKKKLQVILTGGKRHSTIMLFDACFSGRTETGSALVPGLQPLIPIATQVTAAPASAAILSAGKSDEFAGPLPGLGRPAFSYLMLGAVRGWADANGDGKVTAKEATDYTRRVLVAVLKGRTQTPELDAHDGNLVLGEGATEHAPDVAHLVASQ